jgi:tetrahydromethanopterin S-methyltransferase subunit G
MTEKDSENVDSKIARHIGTFVESIQHKLDLIVEGQQMLSEKIDRSNADLAQRIDCVEHKLDAVAAETRGNTEAIRGLDTRLDSIEIKLDAVAADLSAHRADTEAHRKVYKIKED